MIKKLLNWTSYIVIILVIVVAGTFILSSLQTRKDPKHIPSFMGYTPLTILTGSMEPTIMTGEIILIKQESTSIKEGSIITYWMGNVLVTHRVIGVNGETSFTLKGDANNTEDEKPIDKSQIVGTYVMTIPGGKYLKGPGGGILILITLVILLCAALLMGILAQLKKTDSV